MRFDVAMENVGEARRFVRSSIDGSVPDPVATDLVLATSELVTNAFEHGGSAVHVTVRTDHDRASVSVRSRSATADALGTAVAWSMAPPDRISGRGLAIVQRIADHVDIVHDGDDVEIVVHRHLRPGLIA